MKLKLIIFTVFLIIPCWGSVDTIRQLLYSLLNQPRNGSVVSAEKFFSQINENTVRSLSSTDVRQLLPLAKRCLQSPILDVRRDGLLLLMAINLRDDGSILLEPFSSNLELMVTDSADPLRHGVIYVLANITPDASSNIGAFLTAHLEDKYNSMGDRLVIASSLVKFSSDPAVLRKVFSFMENQADASLNVAFLAQIGQLRIRTDEAVMYLRSSLDSANLLIRSAALNAVTKFGPDVRMKFAGQLNRIATDDKESADVRSKAASLLNQ